MDSNKSSVAHVVVVASTNRYLISFHIWSYGSKCKGELQCTIGISSLCRVLLEVIHLINRSASGTMKGCVQVWSFNIVVLWLYDIHLSDYSVKY